MKLRRVKKRASSFQLMKIMSRKVRAFTLLEIVIALLIMSLVGSITAYQVKKMIDVHRFESEVTKLFIRLQEAQVLSAVYQTDLALDISLSGGKLHYRISTDEPFSSNVLNSNPVPLPYTSMIKFKDAKSTKLHFDIFSGGRVEPRGALAFYQSDETGKTLWLDLQRGNLLKFSYVKPISLTPPRINHS